MTPIPEISVSCTECERLSVRTTQLEKRIEKLQDIRANKEFIDPIIALVQAVEPSCAKGLAKGLSVILTDFNHFILTGDFNIHIDNMTDDNAKELFGLWQHVKCLICGNM